MFATISSCRSKLTYWKADLLSVFLDHTASQSSLQPQWSLSDMHAGKKKIKNPSPTNCLTFLYWTVALNGTRDATYIQTLRAFTFTLVNVRMSFPGRLCHRLMCFKLFKVNKMTFHTQFKSHHYLCAAGTVAIFDVELLNTPSARRRQVCDLWSVLSVEMSWPNKRASGLRSPGSGIHHALLYKTKPLPPIFASFCLMKN